MSIASRSLRSGLLAVMVCICMSLFVGCSKDEPVAAKKADFAARLKAAGQINVSSEKNIALDALAVNAAEAGDVDVVKKAIGSINMTEERNTAAAKAAQLLSARGDVDEAIEVAGLINMTEQRNEVLAKIASDK